MQTHLLGVGAVLRTITCGITCRPLRTHPGRFLPDSSQAGTFRPALPFELDRTKPSSGPLGSFLQLSDLDRGYLNVSRGLIGKLGYAGRTGKGESQQPPSGELGRAWWPGAGIGRQTKIALGRLTETLFWVDWTMHRVAQHDSSERKL